MTPRASRLAAALVAALLSVHAMPSTAQVGRYDPAEREARKHKHDEQASTKFPNAKRESPNLTATKEGGKALEEIVQAYNAKNFPEALAQAEALVAKSDNAYEKGYAYQIAGTAAAETKDNAKAIDYYQKALATNALNNDDHFTTMYNLAVVQAAAGQGDAALKTLDRYQAEGGVDASETAGIRAQIMASSDPGKAAPAFEAAWRKNPSDTAALVNAATLYQQQKQFDKSIALLQEAKAKGALTADGYQTLYIGQINAGKDKDALATINEGVAAGKIPQDTALANAYTVLAQNAYAAGDVKGAIDLYGKAGSLASDGEAMLNLARVLLNEGRLDEAKKAAQQALDKGLKHPDDAKKILAKKGK
jgi:tetratricopeptide (TPR) repeat protein